MSDGTPWRPLVHVEDIARAFLAVLEAPRERGARPGLQRRQHERELPGPRPRRDRRARPCPARRVEYAEGGGPDTALLSGRLRQDRARCCPASPASGRRRRGAGSSGTRFGPWASPSTSSGLALPRLRPIRAARRRRRGHPAVPAGGGFGARCGARRPRADAMIFTETKLRRVRHRPGAARGRTRFLRADVLPAGVRGARSPAGDRAVERRVNLRAATLRGLHFQYPPAAETKLVRCTRGAILDVIVDLRPEAPRISSRSPSS